MFATLYLTNDLGTFDINAPVGSSIALLDADHTGPYNSAGILSPSATKPNWIHFSLNLTTADLAGFSFGVIAFELFDFNFIASDSSFLVDNVMVSEVPEPATLSLLGLGALFGARHRRKRKLT